MEKLITYQKLSISTNIISSQCTSSEA